MRKIGYTTQFKKDYKRTKKASLDLSNLSKIIKLLSNGEKIPEIYHDHKLHGKYLNRRELHLKPDLLLIYKSDNENLIFERLGSHSELFC